MDRRTFFKKAGVASAGALAPAALAAPAIAQENPKLNWRLSSAFPQSLDILYSGATGIAERVREATDGNFDIQVFAGGELVPPLQVLDAVRDGTIEMCHTPSYYYIGQDMTYGLGTAVPFGMNARLKNAWLYQGGGNELFDEFFAEKGVWGHPAGNTGAQMGGWFANEINSLEDLKGLKMRIAGLAGQVMAKLGVTPQQIAAGDVYSALERGTIDATEFVGPYDDLSLGLVKVAKYYYYPAWWEGGPVIHAFTNLDKFNELPASYQQILTDACDAVNLDMLARYDAGNPQALRQLVAEGAVLKPFSEEILDACYKVSQETFAEISAENAWFKRIYDSQQEFKKDAYLWMQLAEFSFDKFMMVQQRKGNL
ncbi:TRAP transporter substrate-binding protein [Martelella sp. AD-3]|uniref:TRAP transporter substrate-binding protein n=1 Tax=Martelella sp. AD-3 TaxID=686597 RepID=UPI000465F7BD|nr:TRAP transporter substrate-binding protein [Martelella sp. AD-3]AMM85254.1 ABC transporter substrate-binding protein [Martelella sp. AD-3]